MKTITRFLLFILVAAPSFLMAQKELKYTTESICNDSARIARSTVIITGKTTCLTDPGKDQVILFHSSEEFDAYIAKNKSVRGLCASREPMKLDAGKFDIAFVRIATRACGMPEDTFSSELKNGQQNVYVYLNIKSPGCEDLQIFSAYYLIPKGYADDPLFHFCITGNN
jgi:hypothetical protein